VFVGQSEIGGAFDLRIDRGRGRYRDRSRNRQSRTVSDTEGDSDPDTDGFLFGGGSCWGRRYLSISPGAEVRPRWFVALSTFLKQPVVKRNLVSAQDPSDLLVGFFPKSVVLRPKLERESPVFFPALLKDAFEFLLLAGVQPERFSHVLDYIARRAR
jgi:hypothetical protein